MPLSLPRAQPSSGTLKPEQRLRAVLGPDLSPASLLAGLMADIASILRSPLQEMGVTNADTQELFRMLSQRLLMSQNLPSGHRRVSVCNERAVCLVPIQLVAGQIGESDAAIVFSKGVAYGLVRRSNIRTPSSQF